MSTSRERVPKGRKIKDQDAFNEWIALVESKEYNDNTFIASDGVVYKVNKPWGYLINQIKHLPEQEISAMKEMNSKLASLLGKASTLKNKAGVAGMKWEETDRAIKSKQRQDWRNQYTPIIIELFSRLYNLGEVCEILKKEYQLGLSLTDVKTIRNENEQLILQKQEEYKTQYSDVRLGYKRCRLDELNTIYNFAKEKYFEKTTPDYHKSLIITLEQIRKEVEGDTFTINGNIDINLDVKISQVIHENILKTTPLRNIILIKMAEKLGVNLIKVIEDLARSPYNKVNSVLAAATQTEITEYPSYFNYDWDEIEKNNKAQQNTTSNATLILSTENKKNTLKSLVDEKIQQLNLKKRATILVNTDKRDLKNHDPDYNYKGKNQHHND